VIYLLASEAQRTDVWGVPGHCSDYLVQRRRTQQE